MLLASDPALCEAVSFRASVGRKIKAIRFAAYTREPGDRTFTGTVNSISPASGAEFALLPPDNATGNFTKVVQRIPVKIVLDPESIKGYESRITPGMSAVVDVEH